MYLGDDTVPATLPAAVIAPAPNEDVKAYTRRIARKLITNGLIAAGISGMLLGTRKAALFGGLARIAYDYITGL